VARYVNAGEDANDKDCVGEDKLGTETQARCVKVARRKVMQGELRLGRHGENGRVMVGFGKSRIGSIR